jgi:CheY-like chemotaxis protein
MLQRVLGEDIEFEFVPGVDIHNVEADPVQIEQIIMNLAVNSRDAMPQGGKLIIETSNCYLDRDFLKKYPYVRKGHYVLLMVSDTGFGMDEETLSKIFEPFFTTKMDGEGTGLGLSMVYGITKQSGGHINVYSELNKGTTFKIYLPRVDQPAEKIVSLTDKSVFPRGTETILVVEDDNTVRDMIVDILTQCGYTVYVAKSGKKCLTIWEKKSSAVDLLVTDVVMPGMSGNELAKRLSQSKPGLKVLLMSGYSLSVVSQYEKNGNDISFIQKPFNATDLTIKIREILDS